MEIEALAKRCGVSVEAARVAAEALARGGGRLAQFSHPELGGTGQWMPGMTQIGDMFNQSLKAKVDALFTALASSGMSASGMAGFAGFGESAKWWPDELGAPSSVASQNDIAAAYFPGKQRLALRRHGHVTVHDTSAIDVRGISAQNGVVFVTTPAGSVHAESLPLGSVD